MYRILADITVVIHFVWVLFMLFGFIITLLGLFRKGILDRWLFRTIHAGGILFVSILVILKQYCPLTLWENTLRAKYDSSLVYTGSCIIHYVQKLVYPDINPLILRVATIFIALFVMLVFIVRPPARIKRIFNGKGSKCVFLFLIVATMAIKR